MTTTTSLLSSQKLLKAVFLGVIVSIGTYPQGADAAKDIVLEHFGEIKIQGDVPGDNTTPAMHTWYALTDPVMGGQSTGTATAGEGLGIFVGEVKTVPSLNAPGFIAMQTRGTFLLLQCLYCALLLFSFALYCSLKYYFDPDRSRKKSIRTRHVHTIPYTIYHAYPE